MALGTTATSDTEFAGLHVLLKIFRARCHSSSASEQQPQVGQAQAGSNVGEYLVDETLPLAIACVRDERGFSPPEAVEVLVSDFLSSCCGVCEWVRRHLWDNLNWGTTGSPLSEAAEEYASNWYVVLNDE